MNNSPINFNDPSGHKCTVRDEYGNCKVDDWRKTRKIESVELIAQDKISSNCGQATFAMVWNFKHPDRSITYNQITQFADNGGYHIFNAPFTSPANMKSMAEQFAKDQYPDSNGEYSPIVGNVKIDLQKDPFGATGKNLIIAEIEKGNPLIIDVTLNVGSPRSEYNDSHFIVVTGYDPKTGLVTYYDPYGTDQWIPGIYTKSFSDIWKSWTKNQDEGGQGWYMIVN